MEGFWRVHNQTPLNLRDYMGRNKRKCQLERPFGHSKWFLHISIQALQNLIFGKISGLTCNPSVYCWCCGWHCCNSLPSFNPSQEPSPMQPFAYSPTSPTGKRIRRKKEGNSCVDRKSILVGGRKGCAQKQSKTGN